MDSSFSRFEKCPRCQKDVIARNMVLHMNACNRLQNDEQALINNEQLGGGGNIVRPDSRQLATFTNE